MKKRQIENLEKSEISEITEKLFRVFDFTAKIEISDFKILQKKFRDFRDF